MPPATGPLKRDRLLPTPPTLHRRDAMHLARLLTKGWTRDVNRVESSRAFIHALPFRLRMDRSVRGEKWGGRGERGVLEEGYLRKRKIKIRHVNEGRMYRVVFPILNLQS